MTTLATTAADAYDAALATIQSRMTTIETELAAHQAQQAARPRVWGFAGDLYRIDGQLREILEFATRTKTTAPATDGTSAASDYQIVSATVNARLLTIETALDLHQAAQAKKPGSWGFVGDLNYIASQLAEIVEFLTYDK